MRIFTVTHLLSFDQLDVEGVWKQRFEKFKSELNGFFEEVRKYTEDWFDPYNVIDPRENPIASFDIDGIPHNANPKYEKIINTLT